MILSSTLILVDFKRKATGKNQKKCPKPRGNARHFINRNPQALRSQANRQRFPGSHGGVLLSLGDVNGWFWLWAEHNLIYTSFFKHNNISSQEPPKNTNLIHLILCDFQNNCYLTSLGIVTK